MTQRGRKTTSKRKAAELASVANLRERPEPPDDLNDVEAATWRTVVASKPSDWFGPETLPLLEDYCRSVARGRVLAQALSKITAEDLGNSDGRKSYRELSGLAEKESRLGMALARSMRITQQSQIRADAAGRVQDAESKKPAPPWRDESV